MFYSSLKQSVPVSPVDSGPYFRYLYVLIKRLNNWLLENIILMKIRHIMMQCPVWKLHYARKCDRKYITLAKKVLGTLNLRVYFSTIFPWKWEQIIKILGKFQRTQEFVEDEEKKMAALSDSWFFFFLIDFSNPRFHKRQVIELNDK